ncbi:hypothetical protein [Enterobacteria phage vB_EcoM_IME281]|uniref:Uncharacterized protein n=1 Tax=Enterobacteria phage vB_EcoM_IME281 TaxID=2163887 RepID=A0A2S1GP41_9CAUD|nr:hypothetical protein KNT84_gp140 [Enterobacteria phage vB_EcoM_IME281]AWD91150.1 hypothetical protein [Enterobacteria phage vB_EcoM_IME281]
MKTYNEFLNESVLNEAGVRMTKDMWQAAYDKISGTKTTTEFFKNVYDMYGFDTSSQKEYYKASKAFKDIVAGGSTKPAKPAKAPVAKPAAQPKVAAPKPTPKPEPVKEAPKSKIKFDTSTIVKKYNQLASLVSEIESETKHLVREFNALRNGQHINNLDTPDLYRLYLTVEGLKYTQPMREEINNKLRQAGRIAGDAAQFEKTRK